MKSAWIVLGAAAVVVAAPIAWASLERHAAPPPAAIAEAAATASPAIVVARSLPSHVQVREAKGPDGIALQEYLDADGSLFAITWAGKQRVDARALATGYFAQAQPEPDAAQGLKLVLRSSARPWGDEGVAYVPAMMPLDFDPNSLAP